MLVHTASSYLQTASEDSFVDVETGKQLMKYFPPNQGISLI